MTHSSLSEPLLGDDSQPSTYEEDQIYERRGRSFVTPVLLGGLLAVTIIFIVIGQALSEKLSTIGKYLIDSVGGLTFTSFITGGTCWLALKLILRPCCNCRGTNEIHELVETLFAQYIFSQEVIDQFMNEKTGGLTEKNVIETYVTQILNSSAFIDMIDEILDNFFRSADGIALETIGFSKGTIRPFISDALKTIVLRHCVRFVRESLELEPLSPESLSFAARDYLFQRCEELDPKVVSDAIEEVIGSNTTLVVCWGVVTGLMLSILGRIISWHWAP
jgi:hypothetical protein